MKFCMKTIIKTFTRSVLAGIAIGISGTVYLCLENKVIGAILFSFGLITIVTQNWDLYTGKIGTIDLSLDGKYLPLYVVGNYCGTLIVAQLLKFTDFGQTITNAAIKMCSIKLSNHWYFVLTLAVLCGILMYIAVVGYKKLNPPHLIVVALPIIIFILCGFEHSIADMFYFNLAQIQPIASIKYIIITIVGNGLGALFMKYLNLFSKKQEEEK